MDAITDPLIPHVVVMKSAQTGATEIILNATGYYIHQDPSPILTIQPTVEMAQAYSKDRLAPMLRDTPALRDKVKEARSRDSGNTLLHKTFPGGHWTGVGANAPAGLASRPIRVVLGDERDRFPKSAGTEGDPFSLGVKRTTTFWNRKIVEVSTPTIKGASPIEAAYEDSDKGRYFVPCPDCGHFQFLKWSQVLWEKDHEGEEEPTVHHPETAAYVCEECGSVWDDTTRWRAIKKGEWRSTAEFNGTAGFHLNEIYSPWVTLEEMVTEFIRAKKLPETLQTFINTALGETWEEQGETVDDTGLLSRVEGYLDGTIPSEALVLTAGVDVQDDRLELEVAAWGEHEESWTVLYQIIYGDPSAPDVWNDLDAILFKRWMDRNHPAARIAAAAIDTGGHHTQATYAYCKARERRRIWAIKGQSGQPGQPIWARTPRKNNIGKVNLWMVNVDAAKSSIYARLRITEPGPGYCHFGLDRDAEYFKQLTAEKVITKYQNGFPRRVWIKPDGKRNEALDCRVYAYAALCGLQAMGLDLKQLAEQRDNPAPAAKQRTRRVRSKGI